MLDLIQCFRKELYRKQKDKTNLMRNTEYQTRGILDNLDKIRDSNDVLRELETRKIRWMKENEKAPQKKDISHFHVLY